MKKTVLVFLVILFSIPFYSQNNSLWKGYFSFSNVTQLSQSPTKFFAANENSLFSKNMNTNELKTYTTVDGLSGLTITSQFYSASSNRIFLGYENGLINIIDETDKSVSQVVDIINKGGIAPNLKRINSFYEFDNKLYISCQFGIVVYNTITKLFGDTFIIGPSGQQLNVLQTTVVGNTIYANTQFNGIFSADLANPNLIDFNNWQVFDAGFWRIISTFNDELVGLNTNSRIYQHNGSIFIERFNLNASGLDFKVINNQIATCSATTAFVLNESFGLVFQLSTTQIPDFDDEFTSVSIVSGNLIIGTKESGVLTVNLSNPTDVNFILPTGPARNNIFSIQTAPSGNFLWAVYGDYSESYNPYPLDSYGVSKFDETGWLNIPYEDLQEAKSIVRVAINPSNENQVFFSSYFSGVLKFENDQLTEFYNNTTSNGPESLVVAGSPNYVDIRMNGSGFDRTGNLWVTNSFVNNAMKVLRPNNQWQSYSIENTANTALTLSYGRLSIDKNGTKWFVSNREGVFAFNETATPQFKKVTTENNLGYPYTDTRAIAIDNRNQVWIGSVGGLRILSSVDRFFSNDELISRPIIFVEDGLAQELLADTFITDIVVDGSNNKWIGTADAGVFLLSPNGQQTLQRFTSSNSPLPSNFINDIDINGKTGEVFFATNKGMVSFRGTATKANDNLNNVVVYPNPVRPGFAGTVKITGLVDKANVKITDISGNLVFEKIAEGGTMEWDTTAFGKYKVASGVYMIFISADQGLETKVKKVMIIR
ncbi:type IX secretion system anionic LPS delivery protein PorZ [Flavobacterium orientale]|uniref:ABC transporter substrate-binding protein n=1 Tax=Flavobacterium orientale TaxID=1756020 RepID=A0A917DBH6_9FLAO|nr:T9SS type A sorting domain-containing protein [Flavobacterium orientale]GGD21619.1 ABC transporter substrate-binding protein [Flavobacterium orientale]